MTLISEMSLLLEGAAYTKLATATSILRIEKYINDYAYSKNYRVDPETLSITNQIKAPPENWFVMKYRNGYLFGARNPMELPGSA